MDWGQHLSDDGPQLAAERRAHDAVEEEVHAGVDDEKQVGAGSDEQDPQLEALAAVHVVFLDLLEGYHLVQVEEVPGGVEDQEEDDDGEEHEGLPVLFGGVLGVGHVHAARAWKKFDINYSECKRKFFEKVFCLIRLNYLSTLLDMKENIKGEIPRMRIPKNFYWA